MKRIWYVSVISAIALLMIFTFPVPSSYSQPPFPRPDVYSGDATGMTFTIDGNPSEWATLTPALELNTPNYPIHTYVYFMNDANNLYVLVDAVGDTIDGLGPGCSTLPKSCCDECYLRFDTQSQVIEVEVGIINGVLQVAPFNPAGIETAIGFMGSNNSGTNHRIYEMKIPLNAINAYPGQVINFFSPLYKLICDPDGGSIPFDGGTSSTTDWRDNIWPYWLSGHEDDSEYWGLLHIAVTSKGWESAYKTLFTDPSDLILLRQYRDEFLTKTSKGKLYTTLFYRNSEEALEVLLDNPDLMEEAKHLIQANRDAIEAVQNGKEGTIYNTNEVARFLSRFARKSSADLKLLAIAFRKEMLRKQAEGEKFLGFWLD